MDWTPTMYLCLFWLFFKFYGNIVSHKILGDANEKKVIKLGKYVIIHIWLSDYYTVRYAWYKKWYIKEKFQDSKHGIFKYVYQKLSAAFYLEKSDPS